MLPAVVCKYGRAACIRTKTQSRLIRIISAHPSSVVEARSPLAMIPATLTRTSSRPLNATVSSTAARHWALLFKSATTMTELAPRSSTAAEVSSRALRSRPKSATAAPSSAKRNAVARPIPLEAPVTRATRSSKSLLIYATSSVWYANRRQ